MMTVYGLGDGCTASPPGAVAQCHQTLQLHRCTIEIVALAIRTEPVPAQRSTGHEASASRNDPHAWRRQLHTLSRQ
jgi:hypothetical protein